MIFSQPNKCSRSVDQRLDIRIAPFAKASSKPSRSNRATSFFLASSSSFLNCDVPDYSASSGLPCFQSGLGVPRMSRYGCLHYDLEQLCVRERLGCSNPTSDHSEFWLTYSWSWGGLVQQLTISIQEPETRFLIPLCTQLVINYGKATWHEFTRRLGRVRILLRS